MAMSQVIDDAELLLADADLEQQQPYRRFGPKVAVPAVGLCALAFCAGRLSAPGSGVQGKASAAVGLNVVGLSEEASASSSSSADSATTVVDSSECSALGENCSSTHCCSDPGHQCYIKDPTYAECKRDCVPGPDPASGDGWPWSCEKLGPRARGEIVECTGAGEDCSDSQCCTEPGFQCYQKAEGWATCKPACYPGMDLTDADPNPWSCEALGPRTPGMGDWVPKMCAQEGMSCFDERCCAVEGQICYEKDEYYGECHAECPDGWSCETRGSRTPKRAVQAWEVPQYISSWVGETCSKLGDNCMGTSCCADGGYQCFKKNETWGECRGSCEAGPDLYSDSSDVWSCDILGPKTPGWASEAWKEGKEVSDWVEDVCAEEYSQDCRSSMCCKKVGNRCFEKNEDWASCSMSCQPGHREGDEGEWSCKELGPRTRKAWGKPSLFCFSVVQPPPNYEAGLMGSQLGSGAGIWACDEFDTFSTEEFYIGEGPYGPVVTKTFLPAPVVKSKDGTAGNAELFMHVWDSVKATGKYQSTDFTIKVDPDAVLLPERLRWHLEPHKGEVTYVINCAKPYMPEGPMMFGALEAFSRQALDAYFNGAGTCTANMPWKSYGEDLFMGKCLEMLGVSRTNDFKIYSDGVCRGVDCADPDAAAFHPKKDPSSWLACLEESKNPRESSGSEFGNPDPGSDAQWFKDYMASYTR